MNSEWHRPMAGAKHFTLEELTRSSTARQYGFDNTPGPAQVRRLESLARRLLEPLRQRVGPLAVLSGFRGCQLNWYVSTSRASRHCRGEAADVRSPRAGLLAAAAVVHEDLEYHELIIEHPPHGWLHLSLNTQGPQARRLRIKKGHGGIRRLTGREMEAVR